ncbi:MAG: hypothetical protein EBR42_11255 [Betaproteobacteria bacterium]|nr:hypothetical protein [Betaproteobacteria bacterium]
MKHHRHRTGETHHHSHSTRKHSGDRKIFEKGHAGQTLLMQNPHPISAAPFEGIQREILATGCLAGSG